MLRKRLSGLAVEFCNYNILHGIHSSGLWSYRDSQLSFAIKTLVVKPMCTVQISHYSKETPLKKNSITVSKVQIADLSTKVQSVHSNLQRGNVHTEKSFLYKLYLLTNELLLEMHKSYTWQKGRVQICKLRNQQKNNHTEGRASRKMLSGNIW